MTASHRRLARLLEERPDDIVSRWSDAFERSPMRLRRSVPQAELAPLLQPMIECLALALAGAGDAAPAEALAPGAPAVRELERAVAFAGATMAAAGLAGFDVAALVLALRDALVPGRADEPAAARPDEAAAVLGRLFEWLSVVAMDAFASAMDRAARERVREQLGRGTPVVLVAPRVPATLLVGAPDGLALDRIFGRLVLLVVRTGAPAAIVDAAGLVDPAAPEVLESLRRFAGHDKIAGAVELLAVGLADEHARAWQGVARDAGVSLATAPRFRDAVTAALARLEPVIAS